jgi:preprotein translocase subunit SecG
MFKFLLVVHALISASLVGIILMQRSEGGGLAGGGSPTGMLSARGAGDFLTRTTAILAVIFITLSIAIAAVASINRGPRELDESLKRAPVSAPALPTVPMAGGAQPTEQAANASTPTPAPITANPTAPKVVEKQETPKVERREAAQPKRDAAPVPRPAKVELPPIAAPAAPKVETPAAPPASAPNPPQ